MLEDDDRETLYRDYTSTMQRHLATMIGRYMFGDKWEDLPSFIELAHPESKHKADSIESDKQHINELFGIDIEKALKERG